MIGRLSIALFVTLACAPHANALGERDRFALAQLVDVGDPSDASAATRRLLWEIDKRTSIDVSPSPAMVRLSDEAGLRRYPLLYVHGTSAFALPSDVAIDTLRRHLQAGGTLFIDGAGAAFDASVRALVARLYPSRPLQQLSSEHVLYRSFYLLRTPVGRFASQPFTEGVEHDGRMIILYSQNDLGGAWAKNALGQWDHDVVPGGEGQREMAFRFGVNLAMYVLCQDYKTDQVHVPFILRRRKWQAE